ncbi:hypothetical protein GCK72_025373 [Caenorhabditis remanei]|uniref:Uncharacterized protein n=1 Tax=Caenorhabditis remanei TaxID=31234 RepID=A0A6A5G1T9_CAERE|nr:hypothetical protein GCK72_000838 [Caenorhabditis remanei]XP_053579877.1 hypothetical protein GCK72_025373 [Caenorhabditis remanei]KAF1748906.1 hypothetical protein GCK72_025373 [Caenorhabditis remanei]KAF1769025.1 hypothetical protein GCK72_000838 [Caenorhabditis remanei]
MLPNDVPESDPEGELSSPLAKKTRGGQKRKFGAGTAKSNQSIPARLKSLESTVITLKLLIEDQRKTIADQAKIIEEIRGVTKLTGIDCTDEFPPLTNSLTRKASPKSCALYNEVAKRNPKVVEVSNRLDLVTDIIAFNKKSCTAVIENLPDSKEESQTVQDKSFISKFALDCALPIPIEIFRVKCKNESSVSRPTKVRFGSQVERDDFLKGFYGSWVNYSGRKVGPRPVRARRDMTREELNVLFAIRKEVYDANAKAGLIKFVVHDLKIVELKTPRPLPQAKPLPPASSTTSPAATASHA